MNGMETYNGHVRTPGDAIILFEACRIGLLPRVQRRLSEKERQSIKSGSVFVWDEREAGMRRWTDGKSWSASRVSGSFLTYREMEGKRGGGSFDKNANRDGVQPQDGDSDGGPDGYRYKPDGLMKQSFSITTSQGQHLHLISYFSRSSAQSQALMLPSSDPQLRHIRPEKGMYPDSTVHEQATIPAVTRGPMSSPGYTHAPPQPPYGRPPPYYPQPPAAHSSWAPPSPMHTPPPHHAYSPYYHPSHAQYPGQAPPPSSQPAHYPPHPAPYGASHHLTAFDRPPPPISGSGLPPPPYNRSPNSYTYSGNHTPPPAPSHHNGHAAYQAPPFQTPPYSAAPPPLHDSRSYHYPGPNERSRKDERSDSHHSSHPPGFIKHELAPPVAKPKTPPASGFTIPSISAMLNGTELPPPPVRKSSPGSTVLHGPLQDIPSHKLGFETNRDLQALRNLDKSTFKQY